MTKLTAKLMAKCLINIAKKKQSQSSKNFDKQVKKD